MKIGFVVNRVATEQSNYTTIRLAWNAVNAGHEVALIGLADFIYDTAGSLYAHATLPTSTRYSSDAEMLADLQRPDARADRIAVDQLDVLLLRSDPADESNSRSWAPTSGLLFGQLAAANGVIVLNDPMHLTDAANKIYFQHFPEAVRPRTCITRDAGEIKKFIAEVGDIAVIKPLQGSGGRGVFLIRTDDRPNLNQMIEAVSRDGYVLAQEYLPEAATGDVRLLMLNGRPLCVDGRYACFRRASTSGDMRSNISAGGRVDLIEPDEQALQLAEIVGPKLARDGMYFVGLDIAGDKLMEINVDTPGGINMAEDLTGAPFSTFILEDLQHKVRLRNHYRGGIDNTALAVM
jgi:glutathione synthase